MRWLFLILPLFAQTPPGFPLYSRESMANAAANVPEFFAPNTLVSIYGVNLATNTVALSPLDVANGNLPSTLGFVRVLAGGRFADMIFVSPNQVNFLLPTNLGPGMANIQLVNEGRAGVAVPLDLKESAPGLFAMDGFAIGTHGNGPVVTEAAPAARGEVLVLYATGLGPTHPLTSAHVVASSAARLDRSADFEVRLNDVAVPANHIFYVGVTPGFGGLFQINVRIPDDAPADPEIRVGTPDRMSPAGVRLRVR